MMGRNREEDKQKLITAPLNKEIAVAWSEEGGGLVYRLWDVYVLFEVPQCGGEAVRLGDVLDRGRPEINMRDLLGDEVENVVRLPKEQPPPFYCYGCAATYSTKCRKCGTRHCGNTDCQFHACEECERREWAKERSNTC